MRNVDEITSKRKPLFFSFLVFFFFLPNQTEEDSDTTQLEFSYLFFSSILGSAALLMHDRYTLGV